MLRIDSPESLVNSHFFGPLFECFVLADLYKQYCNLGQRPALYLWRDAGGAHEIDGLLEHGTVRYPLEIKAGTTVVSDFFRGLEYWNGIAHGNPHDAYLIYAGEEKQIRKQCTVLGWKEARMLVETLAASRAATTDHP